MLIVRTGAMGDVVHAMPAVAAMRLKHPDWEIGWAIEPRWRPLLEANTCHRPTMPLVDRIHNVPTRAWNQRPFSLETLAEIRHLRSELHAEHYDICVDMQGLIRSAIVGRLAGADSFVGAASPREAPASWLYGTTIKTTAPHVVDRGCELLGGAIGEPLTAANIPLPIDDAAEAWCDHLLERLSPDDPIRRFAVLAPTAGWGAKRWPVQGYGEVAAALAAEGVTPLINAATAHDPVALELVAASGGCAIPIDCSLTELISLLRRASVVIAGDTGPLHLAAALNRPVVALFGPTSPGRTGPYGTCSVVLRHPESREDHRRHSEPEAGLAKITVEEVTAAALKVMAREPVLDGEA